MTASRRCSARARRVLERLSRDELRDDAVLERADDRAVRELVELRPFAGGDLALSALDEADHGERGDALGCECDEIRSCHREALVWHEFLRIVRYHERPTNA